MISMASVSVHVDLLVMSDQSLITGQFAINMIYTMDDELVLKRWGKRLT